MSSFTAFYVLADVEQCAELTQIVLLLVLIGTAWSAENLGASATIPLIAPPFVGSIGSTATIVGIFASAVAPTIFSWLNVDVSFGFDTHNLQNTVAEYSKVFRVSALVNLACGLFFVLFGSGNFF